MRAAMWVLLAVALLGLVASFVLESGYTARAMIVQPIRRDARGDTGWRLNGPSQELIGVPASAFVTRGAAGVLPQVDVDKLPQGVASMTSVRAAIHTARLGALAATLLTSIGLLVLRRFALFRSIGE